MDRLFSQRPTMQLVLRTWAREGAGFPAILITLMTRLGYRWYPEYMVYEDFHKFNQEQYHADVRIFDQLNDLDTELHIFQGIILIWQFMMLPTLLLHISVAILVTWMTPSTGTFRMLLRECRPDTTQQFLPLT